MKMKIKSFFVAIHPRVFQPFPQEKDFCPHEEWTSFQSHLLSSENDRQNTQKNEDVILNAHEGK